MLETSPAIATGLKTQAGIPTERSLVASHMPQTSLCDALDRLLDTGVVVIGDATLAVAEVDLIYLQLRLVLSSVENLRDKGCPVVGTGNVQGSGGSAVVMDTAPPHKQGSHLSSASAPSLTEKEGSQTSPSTAPAAPPATKEQHSRGLAQLVLTLVKLLHELLERQAVRRMEGGSLEETQMERLGLALMRQMEEIDRMREEFGLKQEDLNLDLGPLGKLF